MRLLLVVHGFPPWAMGGTEIYTHDLARALLECGDDEVHVLTREADSALPEYHVRTEARDGLRLTIVNNTFRECRSFEESYRQPPIRAIAAALFDDVRPDVAHIQHLTCLSTDLVYELSERRIPTLFTLNDYWLICHRGQLFDLDFQRCAGPYPDGCSRCVGVAGDAGPAAYTVGRWVRRLEARAPGRVGRWIRAAVDQGIRHANGSNESRTESARRLAHMRDISRHVTHFLAPSMTLRRRYLEFGVPPDRITYRKQGIDQRGFDNLPRTSTASLRIGFMGSLLVSKAPHLLLEAFAGLPSGCASLQVFGSYAPYHGDDRYRSRLEPLLSQPGVVQVGPIPHDRVPEALLSLDVLVIPSVWIENAPFVIREAFAAGVPVVASNIGGMAEMVQDGRNGLLFQADSAADLRRVLLRLVREPGLLERLRSGIRPELTTEEDAAWMRSMYCRLVDAAAEPGSGSEAAHPVSTLY